MDSQLHILVVDDDCEIRTLLKQFLMRHSFRASVAADGREMKACLADSRIDLVVLDLMLPGEDGLTLCRDLRAKSNIPVIMLTAMGDEMDRIVGLEMGADDYLAKPFNPRELLARIKAVMRRARFDKPPAGQADAGQTLVFGGWTLDVAGRVLLSPQGVVVALSGGEYDLLMVLLERPQRVLGRDQLIDLARGRDAAPFDRSIDIQVSRLRRKLGDDPKTPALIKTIRGGGYMLAVPVEALPCAG